MIRFLSKLIIFSILISTPAYAGWVPNSFTGKLDWTADVSEEDGSPDVGFVQNIKFPNGSVTDNNDGTVSVKFPAATPETDPIFSAVDHHANWDTAYGWGNHSTAGYLTGVISNSPLSGAGTSGSHLTIDLSAYSTKAAADLLYLGISAKAADSDLLDGHDTSYFQVAGSYLTAASIDTSSELSTILTDETGTGYVVFSDSPILVTPNIGVASGASLTLSSLTSGRIPYATTNGLLIDSANLTYNNSVLSNIITSTKTTAGGVDNLFAQTIWNGASNGTITRVYALEGSVGILDGNTKNLFMLNGLNFFVDMHGTGTVSNARMMSIYGSLQKGTITLLEGIDIGFLGDPDFLSGTSTIVPTYKGINLNGDYSRCAITNAYHLYVSNLINTGGSGGGTVTNQYGLYIEDMTAGGTSDYGIVVAGADTANLWLSAGANNTGQADGILFGLSKDTNLYRNAANSLKTDDAFVSGTSITSPIFKSNNADPADAGAIRLGNAESIAWEASPAGTDVTLTVNASEQFVFSNAITGTSMTLSSLTSGRVPIAGASGLLGDDANLTFATDTLTATKISSGTVISTGVVRLKNYTVATLPAGTQGDTAFVTDAFAPTFGATIVGGGAVVQPVFYNGTNWVSY